jgi:branched-chain amino acid transport system substrate-binding protein
MKKPKAGGVKMRKIFILFLGPILILSLAVVVPGQSLAAAKEKTIKIGMIGTFTGPLGPLGMVSKTGALLAQKHINEKGFMVGGQKYKVEFVEWDERMDPKMAVAGANKMMDEGNIKVIIGPILSSSVLAVQPITQPKGVILVTFASAEDIIRPGITHTFRACPDNRMMAAVPATYLRAMKAETLAFIIENEAGPLSSDKYTQQIFEELGGKVIGKEYFEVQTTDFTTQLVRLKAKNPDALFVSGSPEASGLIIKQTREVGWPVQTFGYGEAPTGPAFWKIGGQAIEGHIESTIVRGAEPGPEVQKFYQFNPEIRKRFYKEYWDAYKIDPNLAICQIWYDYVFFILEAMKAAGSVDDTVKIREALLKTDYPGSIFRWKFYPNGQAYVVIVLGRMHAGEGWTSIAACTPLDHKDPKLLKWKVNPWEPVPNIKDIRKARGY